MTLTAMPLRRIGTLIALSWHSDLAFPCTRACDTMTYFLRTFHSSRNSERRRIHVVLPYGNSVSAAFGGEGEGRRGERGRTTAWGKRVVGSMGLPGSSTTTALEAQLNEARRENRGRDLRRERQSFLTRLTREREERVILEAWAASKVQAVFRGFLARPRSPRLRPRKVLTPGEANRQLVADLQAILACAGLPTIPGLGPDGKKAPEGSEWERGQGVVREAGRVGSTWGDGSGGGGRGRQPRSRKQRFFEAEMATRIIKLVRGFLGRRHAGRRRSVWNTERRRASAVRIQRAWVSYRKRMGWRDLEIGVMDRAAVRIQARWRGMACRMALTHRRKEDALLKRKTVSTITIQAAARRRIAVARYGQSLSLGAARRAREARAEAEAARPRRRWNRGGPGAGTGAGSPAQIRPSLGIEDDAGRGVAVGGVQGKGGAASTSATKGRNRGKEGHPQGRASGGECRDHGGNSAGTTNATAAASSRYIDKIGVTAMAESRESSITNTNNGTNKGANEQQQQKNNSVAQFAPEDASPSVTKKRASTAASLHLFEDSIAAGITARKASAESSTADSCVLKGIPHVGEQLAPMGGAWEGTQDVEGTPRHVSETLRVLAKTTEETLRRVDPQTGEDSPSTAAPGSVSPGEPWSRSVHI